MPYFCADADLKYLKNKKLGIIGFGSQGKAQALNVKDSGLNVCIGLLANSKSRDNVEKLGFKVESIENLTKSSDILIFLFPDEAHEKTYKDHIEPFLKKGQSLIFAHGFSVYNKHIRYPNWINVGLLAPKAIGPALRKNYQEAKGVPALIAIENSYDQDFKSILLAYAKAIGTTRSGVFESSFKEEMTSDLFGEQAAICGALTALIQSAYETLTEKSYQKETAYFECIHELKFIVDLIYSQGLTQSYRKMSNTAKYGALTYLGSFKKILKPLMQEILKNIENGQFARHWILENKQEQIHLKEKMKKEIEDHPLEALSANIRTTIFNNSNNDKHENIQ